MLKKFFLIAAVVAAIQNWPHIKAFITPSSGIAAAQGGEVVLYSTAWCGYCEKARTLLKTNSIPYIELDIEKSAEGNRQHQQLGGGGVPVLLIDGEVVRGYAPDRILQLAKRQ